MATKNKSQATTQPDPVEETKAVAQVMPAYMQQFIEQSKADTGALVASSTSVPRLSYRGKRWRFVVDGEEELLKELTVNVVIVGVEPTAGAFIKTLYLTQYAAGSSAPPDCSSSNGITPDIWVSNPQSPRCNSCKQNVFGSAVSRSGGKAKNCHDSKRLWIVKPDDFEVVYVLNVPIMSLKNLAEYGKYIARNNFPLALVITELSMSDEDEFPKLCFNHVGFVEEEMVKEAMDLNQRRPWRTTVTTVLPYDGAPAALPPPPTAPITQPERKQGTEDIDAIVGKWGK